MIASLRKLFGTQQASPKPALPPGERAYAVGDVHGRADLFAALIEAIEHDDAARGPARSQFILLGDLVDRGPDSAGVVRMARAWQARRGARLIAGNHEEMFLLALEDPGTLRHFLRYGGRETALSYPLDPEAWVAADLAEAQALLGAAVPEDDIAYLSEAEDMIAIGDYLFVHAGIAPGVPFEEQKTGDLRWIREPFLSHRNSHGAVVVHGHTITDEVELRANRIGLDTGAYMSGRLTALGLEGEARWLIEASDNDGAIAVSTREVP